VGREPTVPWQLHLATAGTDLAGALLELVGTVDADLLVIGARHRSPVGKALLGSVAQTPHPRGRPAGARGKGDLNM
jgi:nucleotide-binding universal stress UspA family protein